MSLSGKGNIPDCRDYTWKKGDLTNNQSNKKTPTKPNTTKNLTKKPKTGGKHSSLFGADSWKHTQTTSWVESPMWDSLVECSFNQNEKFLNSHKICVLMRRGRWHHWGLGNMVSSYTSRYAHIYPDSWPCTAPIPDLQHGCTILSLVLVSSNPARCYMVFHINL